MIHYQIDHNLNPNALLKMQESIPHFMEYLVERMDESSTCEEFLEKMRETGYLVSDWFEKTVHGIVYKPRLREYEVEISLINSGSAHFKIRLNIRDLMRDNKIRRILGEI